MTPPRQNIRRHIVSVNGNLTQVQITSLYYMTMKECTAGCVNCGSPQQEDSGGNAIVEMARGLLIGRQDESLRIGLLDCSVTGAMDRNVNALDHGRLWACRIMQNAGAIV